MIFITFLFIKSYHIVLKKIRIILITKRDEKLYFRIVKQILEMSTFSNVRIKKIK